MVELLFQLQGFVTYDVQSLCGTMYSMALPVMEFQDQGYKIRKVLAYKSTYPKEIIEF